MRPQTRRLTSEIVEWVRDGGPLHLLVGRLPKIGFVPFALTNATSDVVHWKVLQEWSPRERIITVELVIPVEYDFTRALMNPYPRHRLLLPRATDRV